MFHPWWAALGPRVAVYAVQLPGREDRLREPLVHSLPQVVDEVAGAVATFDGLPLVLFGHSFGAIVAFELARWLRLQAGAGPAALIVSGRAAPHLPNRAPRIAHLPPSEVLELAAERYGGISDAVLSDPVLRNVTARALRADLEMTERYEVESEAPLDCPIAAFGGASDAWVTRRDLDGWQQYTNGEFLCSQFGGDHFYFKAPEILDALLTNVREVCLETARDESRRPRF